MYCAGVSFVVIAAALLGSNASVRVHGRGLTRSCHGFLGNLVNGCSVPFGLNMAYKRTFTPACNNHDICYRCGHSRKWSRRSCDNAFLRDMRRTCEAAVSFDARSRTYLRGHSIRGASGQRRSPHISRLLRLNACKAAASAYYGAVRMFGSSHFKKHCQTYHYCFNWCVTVAAKPV